MISRIRIDGIYDSRTLKSLSEFGISDFTFDFFPKSANFLQQHIFMEIMEQHYSPLHTYTLCFNDEQDFVIEKILNDLYQFLDSYEDRSENIFLEFRGNESTSFCEQFGLNYFYHYNPEMHLKKFLKGSNFKGFVFNFEFLQELNNQSNFFNFVSNFYQQIFEKMNENDLKLFLKMDWNADIFPSLVDSIDFDVLSLPINNTVEISYRNVDMQKTRERLKYYTVQGQNQ